ncbi:MAG: helix-turn-helix domain-containing protein [Solirubrobacterales bacterium]|jgi:cytoskeletal protein RodZ
MSFGENLRRERELRGISLHEIAEATKISVRFLQALEADRYDILPGGIFPRAFVKQYARHIGLDAERVAADFQYLHNEPPPERRAPARQRWSPPPGAIFLGALVVVAALLLTLRRPGGEPAARAGQGPAPVAPAAPAVLPSDRVYPPPASPGPTPVSVPAEGLVLTLTAQQSCWVEVRADGETVFSRVLNEGETETLAAQGELVLSVGNAGGLAIRLNDRPGLPLGRSGEVRKNIVITKDKIPSLVQDAASVQASHSS